MAMTIVMDEAKAGGSVRAELIWNSSESHSPTIGPSQRDWAQVKSIDVVTICEDPRNWKSLALRSRLGDRKAYRQLLEEFGTCLGLFFARILSDDEASEAVTETLRTTYKKLCTCDASRPILPWLLAIASYRARQPIDVTSG